jgi:hypothetical protein
MGIVTIGHNSSDTFSGFPDATVASDNPDGALGSFASFATGAGLRIFHIRPDGLSNLALGTVVNDARIYIYQDQDYGAVRTVTLYPLLVSFVEAEVTWNSRYSGQAWSTGGGTGSGTDRSATSAGSGATTGTTNAYIEFTGGGLITYAQGVIDGGSNFGLCGIGDGYCSFLSRESTDGFRPYFWLDVTIPGGQGLPQRSQTFMSMRRGR